MSILETLSIIYWSGYTVTFIAFFIKGAWSLANAEKVKREHDIDMDIFTILLTLAIAPLFSWLLIIFMLLVAIFETTKENK